jgi:dienelactone hydrolase
MRLLKFENLFLSFCIGMTSMMSYGQSKTVIYKVGNQEFEGYLSGNGKKGAVLVVHNWLGLTAETKSKADALAKLGYTAFAADIFGKGVRPKDSTEAKTETAQYYSNRQLLRDRVNAGLGELLKIAGKSQKNIAAIGYCFGGTSVIELGRSGADIKALVSFHGGLDSPKPEDGKNIKAKVLALHGADDPFVTAENLTKFEDEMRINHIDWQLLKFGGAVHSFTDKGAGNDASRGAAYNESADKRSWAAMKSLLAEIFH